MFRESWRSAESDSSSSSLSLVPRLTECVSGWMATSRVIGMSMRIDRIDNFCFVLRHEIEHILRGDGKVEAIVDSELCEATGNARDLSPDCRKHGCGSSVSQPASLRTSWRV